MPDWYYDLAGRISADRLVVIVCVAFGLIVGPLITLSLDHGQLYGVALMAAGWWPVVLLLKFHPQKRAGARVIEGWFWALVLDVLAMGVPFIVWLATTKR
jgi:hypothetical protein